MAKAMEAGELKRRAEISEKEHHRATADGKGIVLNALAQNREALTADETVRFEQACLDAGFFAIDAELCRMLYRTRQNLPGQVANRPAARPRLVS